MVKKFKEGYAYVCNTSLGVAYYKCEGDILRLNHFEAINNRLSGISLKNVNVSVNLNKYTLPKHFVEIGYEIEINTMLPELKDKFKIVTKKSVEFVEACGKDNINVVLNKLDPENIIKVESHVIDGEIWGCIWHRKEEEIKAEDIKGEE